MFNRIGNRFKSTLINNSMLQYSIKEVINKLEIDIKNIIVKQEGDIKDMNRSINKIIITGFISLGSSIAFIKYDSDKRFDKLESYIDKRFDKLESMIKK